MIGCLSLLFKTVFLSGFGAISLVMDIDAVLTDSIQKYPDGSIALDNVLKTLKRNLNVNEGFTCGICSKVIQHRNNFNRHLKSHDTTHKCFMCNRKFTRIDSLKRHERGHLVGYVRPNDTYNCRHCGLGFKDKQLCLIIPKPCIQSRPGVMQTYQTI